MDFEGQRGGNQACSDATWLWEIIERCKAELAKNPDAKNFYTFFKDLNICFGLDGGFKNPTHGTAQEFDVFQIQHSSLKVINCFCAVQMA